MGQFDQYNNGKVEAITLNWHDVNKRGDSNRVDQLRDALAHQVVRVAGGYKRFRYTSDEGGGA